VTARPVGTSAFLYVITDRGRVWMGPPLKARGRARVADGYLCGGAER
jgi:hypothetical protein